MENYWLWFMCRTKILPWQRTKCMEYFETPKNIFIASEEKVEKLPFLSVPAKKELLESRTAKELSREKESLEKADVRFLSIDHPDYPKSLRSIIDPPYGLFVKGKLPLRETQKEAPSSVAIVGARWASHAGIVIARDTARAISDAGIPVVSGMASGIDGAAMEAAMEGNGKSVAVLGCGPDICYPRCNRKIYERLMKEGVLLSEYPPGTPPVAFHFPLRNRLISALSDVVLVVEAREKSGSLITADYALEQGKDVYAVPGRIDDPLSQGCNRLISQGAGIYCSLPGFLSNLRINYENLRKNELTLAKTENMVYSCVDFRGKNLEFILCETGLSKEEVIKALLSLEFMDLIEEKARYYYRK